MFHVDDRFNTFETQRNVKHFCMIMDPAGVEPASETVSTSSHSQVCLVYYHKLEKIVGQPCAFRPNAPHLFPGNHFDFLFSQESTCYPKLGVKALRSPVTKLLELERNNCYYWQLLVLNRALSPLLVRLPALIHLHRPVETRAGP